MDRLLGAGGRQLAWMRHAGIEHAVEELQLRIEYRRDPRDFVRLDQTDVDRRWDGEHDRLPAHVWLLVLWLIRSDRGRLIDRGLGRHRDDLPLHHFEGLHERNLAKRQSRDRVTRTDDRRIN